MDRNSENRDREQARPSEGGADTGPLNAPTDPYSTDWTPTPQQPPTQAGSYVPPEVRPVGQAYPGQGEPTRQWSSAAPPMAGPTPVIVERRPHRTPILGPLLLIGAGFLLLMNSLGYLDWNVWGQLWQLWPLILVALGLNMLLGRRNPMVSVLIVVLVLAAGAAFIYANGGLRPMGEIESVTLNQSLNGAKSAEVRIKSGVGKLVLDGSEGTLLASGTLQYYRNRGEPIQRKSVSGDTATLDIEQPQGSISIGPTRGPDWNLHLNNGIPIRLNVDAGVGETRLDLRQLKLTDLALNAGVGSVTVQFPENAGMTTAKVNGGVGGLEVIIPTGVEARITTHSGLGGTDVDRRFQKQGNNMYQSAGYSGAKNKLDLDVDVGIGGVDIKSR